MPGRGGLSALALVGLLTVAAACASSAPADSGARDEIDGETPAVTSTSRPTLGDHQGGSLPVGPLPTVDEPGSDIYFPPPSPPSLPPSPTPTSAPTTTTTTTAPPPPEILPSDVLFDTASADLKPAAGPALAAVARQIQRQAPDATLRITGFTDSRGAEDYNQDLSERRAESVKAWFISAGFRADRLYTRGAGESALLVIDTDRFGRFDEVAGQRNRRVEIQVFP